nr:hypothetical protein [Microvirga makkahensis]
MEHKRPTDTDIPGWTPWTQAEWDAWLEKSRRLVDQLAELDAAGARDARNELIDANSAHWGALKEWLLTLSAGKCWFSEAHELFSHYDVEHFRPKKEAKSLDGSERDGYWWLAFDYMNFRVCGNVGNRKKGGWFPLREGSLCSSHTNRCEESETIYLLDPINPADVALLAFDEEGKAIPAPGNSDWDEKRVIETVKRLKLNEHARLTEARRKVWQHMSNLIADYRRAKSRSSGNNPAASAEMRLAAKQIHAITRRDAELSAVARYCVLFSGDLHLTRLVA